MDEPLEAQLVSDRGPDARSLQIDGPMSRL